MEAIPRLVLPRVQQELLLQEREVRKRRALPKVLLASPPKVWEEDQVQVVKWSLLLRVIRNLVQECLK
tara:strand:- start:16 stop:219 length:204 start_codon:yes stop_codon:yes gene_type:complete